MHSPGRREAILDELAGLDAETVALQLQLAEIATQQEILRRELTALPLAVEAASEMAEGDPAPADTSASAALTPAAKIALFRSLFRGRVDVYPRRWTNAKQNTSGYAPACHNEWVRGVCEKPHVKCGECPNQAFIPVADPSIQRHLQGGHVMGIYPLLHDDSCWFLAVDFDKHAWQDDVAAFRETCRERRIPVAIERSRSGNGAHAWFFFATAIPAATARSFGCHLLTETMARRHELRMDSYDRLFPNQDTMPRGGFGNLIALPLQREARNNENTVFLDDAFQPYVDQWAYLDGLSRLEPAFVETIVGEASRRGRILGSTRLEAEDGDETRPWDRPPSRTVPRARIAQPLPPRVRGILSQRLFIEKEGLPAALLNELKRLAAFSNPAFYEKQRMRLPVALTPRLIACAEDLPQHVALPRGCLSDAEALFSNHCISIEAATAPGRQRFGARGTQRGVPMRQRAEVQALLHGTSGRGGCGGEGLSEIPGQTT